MASYTEHTTSTVTALNYTTRYIKHPPTPETHLKDYTNPWYSSSPFRTALGFGGRLRRIRGSRLITGSDPRRGSDRCAEPLRCRRALRPTGDNIGGSHRVDRANYN